MIGEGTTGLDASSLADRPHRLPVNDAEIPESLKALSLISSQRLSMGLNSSLMLAEKSGWLDTNGKRRWFALRDGVLSWFDQPRQLEKGEKPKGSIAAREASVVQIGEIGTGTAKLLPLLQASFGCGCLLSQHTLPRVLRFCCTLDNEERAAAPGLFTERNGGLGGGPGSCRCLRRKGEVLRPRTAALVLAMN